MDRETFRGRFRRRARELRLRLHNAEKDVPTEVLGWTIDATRAGRSTA
jgi:hypothetical protein